MTRLFITLLASFLTFSTVAQTTAAHQLFKTRPTPAALENFYQLYTQSLQQARTTQAHDSVSFAFWDNGNWTDLQHSKIVRNAQQQIIEVVNYDPMAGPTQPVSKLEMTYTQGKLNRQGLLTPRPGGWQQEMALDYRYDAQGNLSSTTFSIWDQQGNLQFFFGDSLEYSYLNQTILGVGYSIGFSIGTTIVWTPVVLIDHINYDPAGKPTGFVQTEFDAQNNSWMPENKIDRVKWGFGFTHWSDLFTSVVPLNQGLEPFIPGPLPAQQPTDYIVTNRAGTPLFRSTSLIQASLVGAIKFESYEIGSGWLAEYELHFSYNAQNKITSVVYAPFDAQTGRFTPQERQTNSYLNAYYTGSSMETFQNNQWTVLGAQQFNYSFDNYGRVTEIVSQSYDVLTASWLNNERITYHYPSATASVGRLSMEDVKIFPNPTQGQLNIQMPANKSIDQLIVRNLQGQQLYQARFTFDNSIEHSLDLSNFPAGMYFVQIRSGSETGVVRVVKR